MWEPEQRAAAGVSVLVAAGSPVSRAGLEAILARDPAVSVVGGEPGLSLAEETERYDPDVIVLELANVADEDEGLEELHLPVAVGDEGREHGPAVVALVDAPGARWLAEALGRGIRALLPRTASAEEILAAVRSVSTGLAVLPASWLEKLIQHEQAADPAGLDHGADLRDSPPAFSAEARAGAELTSREREVLAMIAEGLGNKQIAARLGISGHTVKFHVASLFAKLHASTRAEAVMLGARRGLIVL